MQQYPRYLTPKEQQYPRYLRPKEQLVKEGREGKREATAEAGDRGGGTGAPESAPVPEAKGRNLGGDGTQMCVPPCEEIRNMQTKRTGGRQPRISEDSFWQHTARINNLCLLDVKADGSCLYHVWKAWINWKRGSSLEHEGDTFEATREEIGALRELVGTWMMQDPDPLGVLGFQEVEGVAVKRCSRRIGGPTPPEEKAIQTPVEAETAEEMVSCPPPAPPHQAKEPAVSKWWRPNTRPDHAGSTGKRVCPDKSAASGTGQEGGRVGAGQLC